MHILEMPIAITVEMFFKCSLKNNLVDTRRPRRGIKVKEMWSNGAAWSGEEKITPII